MIAYRGSWLDFEYDKDVLHVRIDRRRKMHATILLRNGLYDQRDYAPLLSCRADRAPWENPAPLRHFYHSIISKVENENAL